MDGDFGIELVSLDGDAVLVVSGEVDASTSSKLDEGCLSLSAITDRLVLDFSRVTFMDSSGLHVLIQQNRRPGTTVVIRDAPEQVLRLLQITELADQFLEPESAQDDESHSARAGP
jgi:anti-anti-sigma factor